MNTATTTPQKLIKKVRDLQVGDVLEHSRGRANVIEIHTGYGEYDTILVLGFENGNEGEFGFNSDELVRLASVK